MYIAKHFELSSERIADLLGHAAHQFLKEGHVIEGVRHRLLLALVEAQPLGNHLHPGGVIKEMTDNIGRRQAGDLPLIEGEHGIAPRLATAS